MRWTEPIENLKATHAIKPGKLTGVSAARLNWMG